MQALLDGRVRSLEFGAGVSLLRALAELDAIEPEDALAVAFGERVSSSSKQRLIDWLTTFLGCGQAA